MVVSAYDWVPDFARGHVRDQGLVPASDCPQETGLLGIQQVFDHEVAIPVKGFDRFQSQKSGFHDRLSFQPLFRNSIASRTRMVPS